MTRIKIKDNKIVEGDMNIVREGGTFIADIEGVVCEISCGPNYTDFQVLRRGIKDDATLAQREEKLSGVHGSNSEVRA